MARTTHREIIVGIHGDSFPVDEAVADLVLLLNEIDGLRTISSCQGDPGIIGKGGVYGHVAFTFGESWQELCGFCFDTLRARFAEYIDDEIRVDIFANTKPYAWINFRSEMLPTVAAAIRAEWQDRKVRSHAD